MQTGSLLQDLKSGARAISRTPGSALISVVVLALGIGLNSFMFSVIYGIYFRGLDVPEPTRLLTVWTTVPERNVDQRGVPVHDLADWRERQVSFAGLAGYSTGTVNLSGAEGPRRFNGAFVSANTLRVLAVAPILGRGFQDGEDIAGAPPNVILGYAAWRDQFGMDPGVLGTSLRVNGEPATIIGVMPEGFKFPANAELWVPRRDDVLGTPRGQGDFVTVIGRLAKGVTRAQAELEFASIARHLGQEYPQTNKGIGVNLQTPVGAYLSPQVNMIFGAMMVAVLCVLIIACANVGNLLLARAAVRTKEAGIRVAIGGGRLQVVLPFFAEALVLASVGALLGIAVTYWGVEWFDTVTDPALTGRPYFMHFVVDWPIVGFVIGVTLLTALAAGIAPALQVSRIDVNDVLKDKSGGSSSLHFGTLSRALVTAQVALSSALLVSAGLMTRSIVNVGRVDYEYETDGLFTARVDLFQAEYADREARQAFWRDLQAELVVLPQVQAAGLTSNLPYRRSGTRLIALEGGEYREPEDMPSLNRAVVSTGYFDAIGVSITQGRDFGLQDDMESRLVAIVNQPFVDRYFDGQRPLGRQFREGAADTLPWLTVVGVVPDMYMQGPLPAGFPGFEPAGYYVPLGQNDASSLSIAVMPRTGDAMAITPDVRGAVRRLDDDIPIYDVRSLAEVIDRSTWFYGGFGTVFIAFGLVALFMAAVGLYGVLSFAVSQRAQEMGLRMALGARAGDVIGLVAKQGATTLGIGLGVGLALAFGATRVIGLLMFNVDAQDPMVFVGVFSTVLLVGVAATVLPAWRATRVDPVVALRYR